MSTSVSDQQVEDVLSSVRRLVSSELPRKPRVQVPEGPGALVLTDAQRVESLHAHGHEPRSHSLEDRVAELEAALGEQDNEFEPDGSEDQSLHRPDRIVYTRPPRRSEEGSRRRTSQRLSQITLVETRPAGDGDDIGVETPAARKSDAAAPEPEEIAEAPMAEDVPTDPRPSAEVHVFSDPDDVVRRFEARVAAGRPISEPLPVETRDDGDREDDVGDEGAAFDAALTEAVAASLPSADAEPETAAPAEPAETPAARDAFDPSIFSADTPDPRVSASVLLSTADEAQDAAPEDTLRLDEAASVDRIRPVDAVVSAPEKTASSEPSVVQPCAVPDPGAPSRAAEPADRAEAALAALPDEEAMQLLVARMLRAELQGELGERITRNVRKLVRQEVKRALTSRDLS